MNRGKIILIDDDDDDLNLLKRSFQELSIANEIIMFNNVPKFLEFMRLTDVRTFFILCDINMPIINGLELKRIIMDDEILRLKCVPFIFTSTSKASDTIMKAYSAGVQGYFIKPDNFPRMISMALSIVTYWSESQHPNS